MCPMSGQNGMKKDAKKWPTYKKSYIKAFDKMIEHRKETGLETDWKNGKEVMDWWINGCNKDDAVEGQTKLCFDN